MVTIDLAHWIAWIDAFVYPLIRIASFVSVAPILGDASVPIRVKIALSVILTIAMQAQIPPMAAVSPDSAQGLMMAATQVAVGAALALAVRLVFAAVQIAGDFIGMEMSLSFASFIDPTMGNTNVVSRLFNTVALLLFVTSNGHLLLIAGLAQTFTLIPLSHIWVARDGFGQLLASSSLLFVSGTLLALPLMITLLTLNLILGILNRTAQQLSVFAVGFPIALTMGLFVLGLMLPVMQEAFQHLTAQGISLMSEVARQMAQP